MARIIAGTRTTAGARTALSSPILLSDVFSGLLTTNFTVSAGTWSIISEVLNNTAGEGDWADRLILSTITTYTDFEITCKVTKGSANNQIIFRSGTGSNSGYGIQLRDSNVFRLESWGNSTLVNTSPFTWGTGTSYQIRIKMQGNHVQCKVWVDGTIEPTTWNIDTNNGQHTTGGIGFSTENSTGQFDDLVVYDLDRRVAI